MLLSTLLLALAPCPQGPYGIDTPTPVGAYLNGAFPNRAPGAGDTFTAVAAYPALRFQDPLVYKPEPHSDHVVVATRQGVVYRFEDDPAVTTRQVFLDIRDRCAVVWDGGFLGLAFHPDYGLPGAAGSQYVYAYYCYTPTGTYPTSFINGFFGTYLRLSRFTVQPGQTVADPSSELVMMQLRLYNGSHRAGDIAFGPDRLLYVPIGDQFRYDTAQDIRNNLEGGIHRIDVDMDPSRSHAPRRALPLTLADERSGIGYWIPNDNPFVDVTGGTFEEYWSLGHRNPHRMTFDSVTGELWSGEIGENSREEINLIQRGGNYGWPFREGLAAGPRPEPATYVGTLVNPVTDFNRNEANAIIGGYVYRGARHPELYGQFICADYSQSKLYALTRNRTTGAYTRRQIGAFAPGSPITFGQNRFGELFIGRQNGDTPLYELAATNPSPDPPQLLSSLGAFANLAALTPAPGFVPYDLNEPFWSDGAAKSRWIAVPNNGTHDTAAEQIVIDRRGGNWRFPAGTVLMKHFELDLDERVRGPRRRLETRFVVFTADDFYTVTYKWLPNGSDAVLLTDRQEEAFTVETFEGPRDQTWTYPGRQDCRVCHSTATGGGLGVRTHQLNGTLQYASGVTDNQLRTWAHLGLFAGGLAEAEIPNLPAAAKHGDTSKPLALRARSYLDSNCSHCHRADSGTRAVFDARLETPLYASDLLFGQVSDELGVSGARVVAPRDVHRSLAFVRGAAVGNIAMPPIAKDRVDDAGIEVVRAWIADLDPSTHVNLGNPADAHGSLDGWLSNLVINESDTWTNTTGATVQVRVEAFRFFAQATAAPVTPFVVRVVGDNDFRVVAIGTTRAAGSYRAGRNALPFADGAVPRVTVLPGQTLATGFLDAYADGAGSAAGSVITFCTCNQGDELWYSGGPNGGDSARVVLGQAPTAGTNVITNITREYGYSIDLVVEEPNAVPTLPNLPDVTLAEGRWVALDVRGTDTDGDVLVHTATGLPSGLALDEATGQLAGWLPLGSVGTYDITVRASDGRGAALDTFRLTVSPPVHQTLYVSFMDEQLLPGGVQVYDEDIAAFDFATGTWSRFFDGSDVLVREDVRGFHILPSGELLFSFHQPVSIPGLVGGPEGLVVRPEDVVLFRPTSLGSNTAGTFEFYFDGSDVFDTVSPSSKIDAIAQHPDGRLMLSTRGTSSVGGLLLPDEDLFAFSGTFGANTAGQVRRVFDGSRVGLGDVNEDLDAACVDASGLLYFSVYEPSSLDATLTLDPADLGGFQGNLGASTTGTLFGYLRAAAAGFEGNNVDALHVQ